MKSEAAEAASATSAAVAALRAGDRRAVARAISRVEQGLPGATELLQTLQPHLGRAQVLGITGAPGAGKSTLVHALLGQLLQQGQRVGVVAVDPSSPVTGGAVLGDRVRMGEHGAHANVFIRSVAARGHLGGLSPTTRGIVDVMDAAGFDTVIVETVGAGQSEIDVMHLADTRVVVCPPGLGDAVQAIKAGILEIADVLVVSKADLPGAEVTARDLRDMLHLRQAGAAGAWAVPVLRVSGNCGNCGNGDNSGHIGNGQAGGSTAPRSDGVAALLDAVQAHGRSAQGLRGRRLRSAQPPPAANGTPAHAVAAVPEAPAQRVRRLATADAYVRGAGFACVDAGPGWAEMRLQVTADHLNFNGTCHGGVVFALADTAFGLAANSHGTVAAGIDAHITYQAPARVGDVLLARAEEVSRSRRLAVYRVDVRRAADGRAVSSFTGTVFVTETAHAEPATLGTQARSGS